eukprot:UN19680
MSMESLIVDSDSTESTDWTSSEIDDEHRQSTEEPKRFDTMIKDHSAMSDHTVINLVLEYEKDIGKCGFWKIGQNVEVLTQSCWKWCSGVVSSLKDDFVTVKYVNSISKKNEVTALQCDSQHLRLPILYEFGNLTLRLHR